MRREESLVAGTSEVNKKIYLRIVSEHKPSKRELSRAVRLTDAVQVVVLFSKVLTTG